MGTNHGGTLPRRARLESGAGGMVAGTGLGALLIHLGLNRPKWGLAVQYLAPALSIVTSSVVVWLRFEWDTFAGRKFKNRQVKELRARQADLAGFIETTDNSTQRKLAQKLMDELDGEILQLLAY